MNSFVMMVGLPGSGKSTYANYLANGEENVVIHSSDDIREELSGNASNMNINKEVFNLLHERVIRDLKAGKNVIYDATNLSRKRRVAFLEQIKSINIRKVAILVWASFDSCVKRQEKRERKVPKEVIKRMYCNFQTPTIYDGFNQVIINYNNSVLNFDTREDFNLYFKDFYSFDQENKYHTLSVYRHTMKAINKIQDLRMDEKFRLENNYQFEDFDLAREVMLFHDIGKKFTKTFRNTKGEITENAHYYGHESVGAYDVLGYRFLIKEQDCNAKNLLVYSLLINLHMLHNLKPSKKEKYRKMFGDRIMNSLEIMQIGDLNGK